MTYLTEEEARKRWCCGPPSAATAVFATSKKFSAHIEDGEKVGHCIASECMAWRVVSVNKGTLYHPEHVKGGYCGLAGKPE